MNPVKVILEHRPGFKFCPAKVEKTICLPDREFERFLKSPMEDQEFIKENVGLMHVDKDGVYHCLLVTGEGRRDGVLVEAEGYGYARYTSYVPDAAAFAYDSLSEMGYRLAYLVDLFVRAGAEAAGEYWDIRFEDIREQSDLVLEENDFLRELMADMIVERPEVASVGIRGDHFCVRLRPELLQGSRPKEIPEQGKQEAFENDAPGHGGGLMNLGLEV